VDNFCRAAKKTDRPRDREPTQATTEPENKKTVARGATGPRVATKNKPHSHSQPERRAIGKGMRSHSGTVAQGRNLNQPSGSQQQNIQHPAHRQAGRLGKGIVKAAPSAPKI